MNTKDPVEMIHYVLKNKSQPKIKLIGDSITHGVGGTGFAQTGASLDDLLVDGVHPNDRGYDVMYALICGALGLAQELVASADFAV